MSCRTLSGDVVQVPAADVAGARLRAVPAARPPGPIIGERATAPRRSGLSSAGAASRSRRPAGKAEDEAAEAFGFVNAGTTWVVRKIWGRNTEPTLNTLRDALPGAGVSPARQVTGVRLRPGRRRFIRADHFLKVEEMLLGVADDHRRATELDPKATTATAFGARPPLLDLRQQIV